MENSLLILFYPLSCTRNLTLFDPKFKGQTIKGSVHWNMFNEFDATGERSFTLIFIDKES